MKLLFVADGLEGAHLAESGLWLAEIAARAVSRGHRVEVVCRRGLEAWQEPEDPPGVIVHRPIETDFEATFGEALARQPDAIHLASRGPFGGRICEILPELPVLLDVHDFWPICPNDDLLRQPGHEPCDQHFPFAGCGACAGLTRLRAMDERAELARAARAIVVHSAFMRTRLQAGLGRPVELIPPGVDIERFRPDPDAPLAPDVAEVFASPDRPRVLLLGAPSYVNGAGLVIDLLTMLRARIPDVELVVAGRDPLNPDGDHVLRAESKELGIAASLRQLPRVAPHDLPALIAACKVAIGPAPGFQPGGASLLQALACGVPVVVSPMGAYADLIRHGEEGLLLPVHDLSSFASGVCSMLLDPMAHAVFRESARLRAVEHHDMQRTLFQVEDLWQRLRSGSRFRAAA